MPPDPDRHPASDLTAKLTRAGTSEVALLHFLLENIPARIYFKDKESRFIRISRAMAKFHGMESGLEAVGKTDFDLFAREHAEPAFTDEQQVMQTGEPIVDKVEKETLPDGEIRWALTTKMPLRSPRGEIIGTCGITQDVTAQKRLEDALAATNEELVRRQQKLETALTELSEAHKNLKAMQQQLLEAEKMQALGRLAFGVAHEIRNPLNICQAGLDFFGGAPDIQEDPAQVEILDEMKSAIARADAVICTLMETSSPVILKLETCNVRKVIEESLDTYTALWARPGIKIAKDFATDLPPLKLDRSKMKQVFDGLLTNALEAMGGSGELIVRTRLKQLTDAEIERDPGIRYAERFRAGDNVAIIEIEDTGHGVSAEALPKIFDPFFTTKETGEGIGLGLTVCRKIVELHQGILRIANRDGGGARVSLLLKIPA
jgi:PAS domain S-box-containing protein